MDVGRHDPGRQANKRRMRLLRTVGRPELIGPVTQRNLGVAGLTLIAVIAGLDIVGGGNAELLGLLVSPPIVAASFVGPKRTVAVGLVALAAAVGYGRAVGVDLLAGSQGVTGGRDRGRDGAVGGGGAGAGRAGRAAAGGHPGRRGRPTGPAGRGAGGVGEPAPGRAVRLGQRRGVDRGDFYEALETPHGVRLLVGDVRGKGLDAVRLAGVVLGSFRDAAQDHPDLAQVTAALDQGVTRAIGPEDFVTAVLVQVAIDGNAIVVNRGHPAPLLVRAGQATELDPPEPAPPLGLGPHPEPLRLTLALGDRILLYTDGPGARGSAAGSSRCRPRRAFALVSDDLEAGLESLWAELQRHVAGQLHDDVALLLIEHSR